MPKNVQTTTQLYLLHMLQSNAQTSLRQHVNCEIPDVQAGFIKARGTRDQIASNPLDHRKSNRVPEKHLFLLD